jgi:hypothetical protein
MNILIAILTVVIGALLNAELNRWRDDRLRKEDAAAVAAALYGEIVLLRHEAAALAAVVARVYLDSFTRRQPVIKFDAHFLEAHKLSDPILYKALAPKIGILSADLVISITEFHKNFHEVKMALPLLVDDEGRRYSYSPTIVLRPAIKAVNQVVPALKKIESMVGVAHPAVTKLDVVEVEAVIDMEQQRFSAQ